MLKSLNILFTLKWKFCPHLLNHVVPNLYNIISSMEHKKIFRKSVISKQQWKS